MCSHVWCVLGHSVSSNNPAIKLAWGPTYGKSTPAEPIKNYTIENLLCLGNYFTCSVQSLSFDSRFLNDKIVVVPTFDSVSFSNINKIRRRLYWVRKSKNCTVVAGRH